MLKKLIMLGMLLVSSFESRPFVGQISAGFSFIEFMKTAKPEDFKNLFAAMIIGGLQGFSEASDSKDFDNAVAGGGKMLNKGMVGLAKGFKEGAKPAGADIGAGMGEFGQEIGKGMQDLYKAKGELAKGLDEGYKLFNKGVYEIVHKNLATIQTIMFIGTVGYYVTAHGVPLAFKMLERSLMRPKLIIESSVKTWTEMVLGKKKHTPKTMVFAPALETRLNDIVESTTIIQKKIKEGNTNVKYRNLMLYGPPGTGKTMFATELARRSGLEYAFMSGSSFSKFKDGEGIEALDELFAWANKSKKGLLIFIDEAETFLLSRDKMDPSSKAYLLLNNFLNYTGTRSNKFMIVFATNHKEALDSAMYRRIDDLVEVTLPGQMQRADILKTYIKEILLDVKQNGQKFVDSAINVLTDSKIKEMSEKTQGLSGSDLEGIVHGIKVGTDVLPESIVTSALVDAVVKQYVEKHLAFTKGKQLGFVVN